LTNSSFNILCAPTGYVERHERLEEATVIWHPQMNQFVHNDEILKGFALVV